MRTRSDLKNEISALYQEGASLAEEFRKSGHESNFFYHYQSWYSRALGVVRTLAPDRYDEFKSYYEIDPRRKALGYGTYVIQDYMKGVIPSAISHPGFDDKECVLTCFITQITILQAVLDRAESALGDLETELLSEIRDAELATAESLLRVSVRAAGAVAGVVVESHLQKLASKHGIKLRKKSPTIADLNDPLRQAGVYDTPTWRKISYLADIRNLATHKKAQEPSKEQVRDLIDGANWLIKSVF